MKESPNQAGSERHAVSSFPWHIQRDFKTANILISNDGEAKIAGLGIATEKIFGPGGDTTPENDRNFGGLEAKTR